eukprot:1159635-Pelagomonas_calceolata.AAC.14
MDDKARMRRKQFNDELECAKVLLCAKVPESPEACQCIDPPQSSQILEEAVCLSVPLSCVNSAPVPILLCASFSCFKTLLCLSVPSAESGWLLYLPVPSHVANAA